MAEDTPKGKVATKGAAAAIVDNTVRDLSAPVTDEQKARDMLARMGVPNVHNYNPLELVELASLIARTDPANASDLDRAGYIAALERRIAVYEAAGPDGCTVAAKLKPVTWKLGATKHMADLADVRIGHAIFSGTKAGDWIAQCQIDGTQLDGFGSDESAMRATEARVLEVLLSMLDLTVVAAEGSADA